MTNMRAVISTGAGISKSSGLPVYRGDDGTWTNNPALEAMSTAKKVASNIGVLWEYWGPFRQLVLDAKPNQAHMAIARMQVELMRRGDKLTVITQNVDDLHFDALHHLHVQDECTVTELKECLQNIITLHGSIFQERCLNSTLGGRGCSNKEEWNNYEVRKTPGECGLCGGASRPAVVLFGEKLPPEEWRRAESACLGCNVYIAAGTSGIVYPAAELVSVAKSMGANTILANKDDWDFPHPDFNHTVLGDAEEIIPAVFDNFVR